MTHGARMIVRPGVWTGAASEASCRLSCRRRCRRTTASPLAWARASSHAPTRSTKSHLACDVRGDVVHPAVGGIEGHHAQGIQHQIHGAVPAVGKRQHCGAVGYGTHARLRAGVAEAVPRSLLGVVSMGGAVHGRRGRAPKTPTLLDVLWVRGRLKLQNQERSLPRVLDSNLRVTASPTRLSLGVASCQREILSLKKAVWRLWLVSKSRMKNSVEGCEQLLRRAASVARPSSSQSHARSVLSRTMCGRTDPPLWGLLVQSRSVVESAMLMLHSGEALWDRFFTAAPRPRTPSELLYSDRRLRSKSSPAAMILIRKR